jgi:hypothetical protein
VTWCSCASEVCVRVFTDCCQLLKKMYKDMAAFLKVKQFSPKAQKHTNASTHKVTQTLTLVRSRTAHTLSHKHFHSLLRIHTQKHARTHTLPHKHKYMHTTHTHACTYTHKRKHVNTHTHSHHPTGPLLSPSLNNPVSPSVLLITIAAAAAASASCFSAFCLACSLAIALASSAAST